MTQVQKASPKSKPKAVVPKPRRRADIRYPLPDVFVDGKRYTGGPTIFDPPYVRQK